MRTSNSRVLERTVPRVAYFEDVQGIARYMEDQLSRRGVLVDLPASIEECELLATRECVEAFILDVDMGEGREREGLDALKRLKEIDPAIFCALLTDHHDNDQVRAMANHLGCDAFLGKSSTDLENIGQVLSVLEAKWPGLAGRMPVDARTDDFDDNDSESSDGQDELQNTRERFGLTEELVERHHELLARSLSGSLTPGEEREFAAVQAKFSLMEAEEARLINASFPETKAGKLEDALRRVEDYIDQFRRLTEQRQ